MSHTTEPLLNNNYTPQKATYIDLFAGCGGLSLGLFNSGLWKGLFAVEKSKDAFETLEHNLIKKNNHFNWPSWLPQEPHDINALLKDYSDDLMNLRGKVDLVTGGPPCQGFSASGLRNEGDLRNQLIKSYVKFIRVVQPKVIFFENVKGFTQKFDKNKTKGKAYSEFVKRALKRTSIGKGFTGYRIQWKLVDFSEFGVPQKRTRFILVGVRKDISSQFPVKKFFNVLESKKEEFLVNKGIGMKSSLEDAISDLLRDNGEVKSPDTNGFKAGVYSKAKSNYQKLLRRNISKSKVPDSHRFANHRLPTQLRFEHILRRAEKNKTLNDELKLEFGLKKRTLIPLGPSEPAPTITTLPDDYLHYCEPRIFTVREYARIQSFDDSYEFCGKYTTGGKRRTKEVPRYSQIGNAIPPLFGEQSGEILNELIKRE